MPPRYLIIKGGKEIEIGSDYADYLAAIEDESQPSTLKKIPAPKHDRSEWDNHRPDVPPGFRTGKDVL